MLLLKRQSKIALIYFFIIALLGVIMRLFPVANISVNYKNLLHTHSHIALLGWIYTALSILIYKIYLQNESIEKNYRQIFWFTQFTIIGMLLSFPFMGYAFLSILFSTLFLVASYFFAWLVFKFTPQQLKQTRSFKFIKTSLFYMILSSLGPWVLGYIINTSGVNSSLYKNAIYFYLHFQYNGWFIMAVIGIFLRILEEQTILIPEKTFKIFFELFNSGVIATFLISILWMEPPYIINLLAGVGSIFQIIAFFILIKYLLNYKQQLFNTVNSTTKTIIRTILILFLLKLIFQILACYPHFSEMISYNKDLVIAYLHWVFLGVVSISLFIQLFYYQLIRITKLSALTYLIGFLITEGLLFYKGTVTWLQIDLVNNYYWLLVIASGILFLAILYLLVIQFTSKVN